MGKKKVLIIINYVAIREDLIEKLPEDVNPCGENGKLHTLCFDGPIFNKPLDVFVGQKVIRTYKEPSNQNENIIFGFCDVTLTN